MRIRTLVADSDHIFRAAFRTFVAGDPEIELVAECDDGQRVWTAVREHSPSLMLLDTRIPGLDCVDLVAALGEKALLATIFIVPPGRYTASVVARSFEYLVRPVSKQ